jgi:sugar-specific transcriptional regulator TrmB
VLKGDKKSPEILSRNQVAFPEGFTRPQELQWLLQDISDILEKNKIDIVAIKGSEAIASRGKPFVERVENEAIVQLAATSKGIKRIYKKVKCTIAKDLGLKGIAKSLETDLDYSIFPDFKEMDNSIQDAILVGWSSFYGDR